MRAVFPKICRNVRIKKTRLSSARKKTLRPSEMDQTYSDLFVRFIEDRRSLAGEWSSRIGQRWRWACFGIGHNERRGSRAIHGNPTANRPVAAGVRSYSFRPAARRTQDRRLANAGRSAQGFSFGAFTRYADCPGAADFSLSSDASVVDRIGGAGSWFTPPFAEANPRCSLSIESSGKQR